MSSILKYLIQSQNLDRQIDNSGLRHQLTNLRNWQCRRLLLSYEELYQQEKYRPAMDFFIQELYGANDFTQRDKDIEKVLPLMEKVLSTATMETFGTALKLNSLSYQLDIELLKHLHQTENISTEEYTKAYQASDNLQQRQQQIVFIECLANNLAAIAQRKSIIMILKLSRNPAKLAGLSELQRILETGACAFKKIGKIDAFIQPVLIGEREVMANLFQGINCLPQI